MTVFKDYKEDEMGYLAFLVLSGIVNLIEGVVWCIGGVCLIGIHSWGTVLPGIGLLMLGLANLWSVVQLAMSKEIVKDVVDSYIDNRPITDDEGGDAE